MSFVLDPRLEGDSTFVCDFPLSQVRLSNNASFPWIILIPRKPDMVELVDLSWQDQIQLQSEVRQISLVMKGVFAPDKLNIASLGNIVPQLHIHVVARYKADEAWPNPVWNSGIQSGYVDGTKDNLINEITAQLK